MPTVWMLHPGKPAGVYRSVHRLYDPMELEEYCMCRMEHTEPISSNTDVGDCLVTLAALTETSPLHYTSNSEENSIFFFDGTYTRVYAE